VNLLPHRLFVIFLTITAGAFNTPAALALHLIERASEYDEERDVEKENEEESNTKSGKSNFDGPEFDSDDFFSQLPGNIKWFSNQPTVKTRSTTSICPLPLYILHHNLKLDCPQQQIIQSESSLQ
jgi:hypothetical protein